MTDKQIIETIKNLKDYCKGRIGCVGCRFYIEKKSIITCQIRQLANELTISPQSIDMGKIERIINE